MFKKVINTVN